MYKYMMNAKKAYEYVNLSENFLCTVRYTIISTQDAMCKSKSEISQLSLPKECTPMPHGVGWKTTLDLGR